jgi:mannose-6-phosphate isomerase
MTNGELTDLYPLRFEEILRDYGFGDRWITREFAKTDLPEDHRIAETWEVCDRPGESSSILNGSMRGQTLHQAIEAHGEKLLGRAITARFGLQFPLLIKLLDASNTLGEHVHPSDELVAASNLTDFSGKTEAWYMLRARPGASILCGHRPGVTAEDFLQAMLEDRTRSCMREHAAAIDDSFLLYPGTMHYSSGGLLFYEIMQNSDINIGLRPARSAGDPTAVEARARQALRAVHFENDFDCRTQPLTVPCGENRRTFLIVCQHFALERLDLTTSYVLAMDGEHFKVATVIEGTAALRCASGTEHLANGQSCLLPADLGQVTIQPQSEAALLIAYVPDLETDIVAPLRSHGVEDQAIRALGGNSELNPLNALTER